MLAENAARRKERITDFSEKINNLAVYTKDNKVMSMIKAGLYTKMIADTAGTDINSLYKVTEEFKGEKGSLSTAQLANMSYPTRASFPSEQFTASKNESYI